MGCCESAETGPTGAAIKPLPPPPTGRTGRTARAAPFRGEWPWSRAEQPVAEQTLSKAKVPERPGQAGALTGKQAEWWYSAEFLQSFKILSATEAEAYEVYQQGEGVWQSDDQVFHGGDAEGARKVLGVPDPDLQLMQPDPLTQTPLLSPSASMGSSGLLDPLGDLISPRAPKGERGRGGSVAASATNLAHCVDDVHAPPPQAAEEKPAEVVELLRGIIRSCPLFAHLSARLQEDDVVLRAMERVAIDPGRAIFAPGADPGALRGFYVVVAGELRRQEFAVAGGELRSRGAAAQLGAGSSFGEAMVMNAISHSTAAVSAAPEGAVVYWLSHDAYKRVMSHTAYHRREKLKQKLRAVRLDAGGAVGVAPFAQLPGGEQQLAMVADALQECHFPPGAAMIQYGAPVHYAHIIVRGTVLVIGRSVETFVVQRPAGARGSASDAAWGWQRDGRCVVDIDSGALGELTPAAAAGMCRTTDAGQRVVRWEVETVDGARVRDADGLAAALRSAAAECTVCVTTFIEVCRFSEGEDPVGFLELLSPGGGAENAVADVIADPDGADGVVTARIGREDFERTVGAAKDLFHQVEGTSKYQYYQAAKQRAQRRFTIAPGSPRELARRRKTRAFSIARDLA